MHLKEQTGSLAHRITGKNAGKLDGQKLAKYVQQYPNVYLHEMAEHFNCSKSAIFYALKRMGVTRKKKSTTYKEQDLNKAKYSQFKTSLSLSPWI